jgi:hypothetical protein
LVALRLAAYESILVTRNWIFWTTQKSVSGRKCEIDLVASKLLLEIAPAGECPRSGTIMNLESSVGTDVGANLFA